MPEVDIVSHITALVEEEKQLRHSGAMNEAERNRINEIEVQLDQCWDLLRRREAREEFSQDPTGEQLRSAPVVEQYLQ